MLAPCAAVAISPSPQWEEGRVRGAATAGFLREAPREHVKRLRRDQTDAERILWARLRDCRLVGAKFRRQRPVGPFIVDLCCLAAKLIVEVDGRGGRRAG